jgi:hypothetical protein
MRGFIQALTTDTDPPVTGMDARIPVVMALAAQESLRQHRPISIPNTD